MAVTVAISGAGLSRFDEVSRQTQHEPGHSLESGFEPDVAAVLPGQAPRRWQAQPATAPRRTAGVKRVEQVHPSRCAEAGPVVLDKECQTAVAVTLDAQARPTFDG